MAIEIDIDLSAPIEFYNKRKNRELFPLAYKRTDFQRDKDRILFCKSFRRMSGKTQIFLPSSDDHFRTRLTHTLEVMQIATQIGMNLGLDIELIEAISLGHDIGHTPFGHIGERTLNLLLNGCDVISDCQNKLEEKDKGFKHNWQSVRALANLRSIYNFPGLNLTPFTLWGIYAHTDANYGKCDYYKDKQCYITRTKKECNNNCSYYSLGFYENLIPYFDFEKNKEAWSFEAFVVAKSDEIAQRHHDIEDGLVSKLLTKKYVKDELFGIFNDILEFTNPEVTKVCGNLLNNKIRKTKENENALTTYISKFVLNTYSSILIEECQKRLMKFIKDFDLSSSKAFSSEYKNISCVDGNKYIGYPNDFNKNIDKKLGDLLTTNVIKSHLAQEMDGKGRFIIRNLVKAYMANPRQLRDNTILAAYKLYEPENYKKITAENTKVINDLRGKIDKSKTRVDDKFQIALLRSLCDHIAGMTDNYAIAQNKKLYG